VLVLDALAGRADLDAVEVRHVVLVRGADAQLELPTAPGGGDVHRLAEPERAVRLASATLGEAAGKFDLAPGGVVEIRLCPAVPRTGVAGIGGQRLLARGAGPMVFAGEVGLVVAHHLRRRGMLHERLARGPGLGAGAAPRGVDHADGHLELVMQPAGEEVADAGERGGVLEGADGPCALEVALAAERRLARHGDHADAVAVLGFWIGEACREGELHVRLSGADPDLAYPDVFDSRRLALVPRRDLQRVGASDRQGREAQHEVAGGAGDRPGLDSGDLAGDFRVGQSGAPNRNGDAMLEDGVVGEQGIQFHEVMVVK